MQKFLIDTDVLVDFFHDAKYAKELIAQLAGRGLLFISILTITELRTGFTEKQAEFFLPTLYRMVTVVNLTTKIAELAGKFRFGYRIKGKILSTVDTLIAATAITNNYQLVTRNKRDYPMAELRFYSSN